MEDKKPLDLTGNLSSGAGKYQGKAGLPIAGNMPNVQMPNGMPAGIPQAKKQKSPEEVAKEFEALKKKLSGFQKKVLSKYKFTKFLSILPAQSLGFFAEDENMPVETEKTNPLLLLMVIPEEQYKNIPKIRPEIVKLAGETKENLWVLIKTEVDLWNYGLDSKYEFLDAVSASYPLYDDGFLGTLRLASIHKSLVLRKFEKYVASYVIGGSLIRGEAGKDSDVDTFVIIDDTDVKRMNRIELLEKLRGIIHDYIREATALAGVKNRLEVQVYLLTDFWQSVKDANPVMFTFIRDGIPLYDRGTFIPWKLLLKMGKIKPSPESVDMFMKSGEQNKDLVKRRLIDAMVDIFWGVTTPTQALMMLAGNAPPEPKNLVREVQKVLVDKEKLMSMNELKYLEKVVKLYKDYEHGKLNEISGKEIDEILAGSNDYVKKMKVLREKIEKRMQEHQAEEIDRDVFDLLKQIFGAKGKDALIGDFDKELVKKGKIQKRLLEVLKEVGKIKQKVKGKAMSQSEMQKFTAETSELIDGLTEYAQRKDLVAIEKGVLHISYGDKKAEVVLGEDNVFVVSDGKIRKIEGKKLVDSTKEEMEKAIQGAKDRVKGNLSSEVLDVLKKEFGDFTIGF